MPTQQAVPKTNAQEAPGLVRGLGVWASTAIAVGAMIGQSVFLVASDISREVGSMPKVLLAWIVGGVIVLCGAFCYAELGAAMPEAGADYIYLSRGLSPVWGFSFGWTSALIIRPGVAAGIAAGLLRFVGFLAPSVSIPIFVWHLRVPFQLQPYQLTLTPAQLWATGAILVVTGLNYVGVRTVGRFQVFLTSLKVAAVAGILILGFRASGFSGAQTAFTATPAHGSLVAFLAALVPVMAAYNGFQNLGQVGGEVVNPGKNLPRAVLLGTSLVIVLSILVNWVYFHVLSFAEVAHSQHVASDAVARLVGIGGAKWFTLAMVVSAFGSLHSGFVTGPRVPYAMAQDGNFFSFAKRIHPVFRSPSRAVLFQGCVATLLVLTGSYQELYSYTMFATWMLLALIALAVIRLRAKKPELTRPYRVWGYPWTCVIFGSAALAISANLLILRPVRSSAGLAVILLGIPFFYHWRKRAAVVASTGVSGK